MKFLYLNAAALAIVAGACTPHAPRTSAGPLPAVEEGGVPPRGADNGSAIVTPRRTGIDPSTRASLALARATDYKAINVAVLTQRPGTAATDSAVAALQALGGQIEMRLDEIGYIRALMPVASVSALNATSGIADYEAVQQRGLNTAAGRATMWYQVPTAASGATTTGSGSAGTRTEGTSGGDGRLLLTANALASEKGYVPLDEIRADAFARRAPLADGRGTTIGVAEQPFDFNHEAFREARTLAGDTVAKLTGLLNTMWSKSGVYASRNTDPRERAVVQSGGLGAAVRPDTVVMTNGDDRVAIARYTVRLPEPGTWRVAYWARVGWRPTRDTLRYIVAWRDTLGLWVDLNRDGDLRNDGGAVPNFNVRPRAAQFPRDSAAGASESVPFVVIFDARRLPHVIHQGWSEHSNMLAGTSAGSHFLGTAVGGVAPGARLLAVTSQLDPLDVVLTARDPRTDVVVSAAGNGHFPGSGDSFIGHFLDRAIDVYQKPITIGASNVGPSAGSVQHTAAAGEVIGVGAYASKRSYGLHWSWHVPDDEYVMLYSARGPAANGAFKPDILAPSPMVTPDLCASGHRERIESGTYRLPACYQLGSGTSNASPFAGGVVARLISAARLNRWPASRYDPSTIAWALTTSARQITTAGMHEQGAGLIQLDSAWVLMQLGASRPRIASSGPVENAFAPYLATPGRGPGLYLREGWSVGRRETRVITLRRTTGPAEPTRYRLRWRGNDGTFSLAETVVMLPRGSSVDVPVTVAPNTSGMHSAALEVLDATTDVVWLRVPTTVVAALSLTPANGFSAHHADSIAWPRARSVFVNVPAGTAVLRLEVAILRGMGNVTVRGPLVEGGSSPTLPDGPTGQAKNAVIQIEDPMPGTWELTFASPKVWADTEPAADQRMLTYSLDVAALMARVEETPARENEMRATFINAGAPIAVGSVRGSIGLRRVFEGTIAPSATDALSPLDPITIQVDSGTTSLRVKLTTDGAVDALTRHADLHLFECPQPDDCRPQAPIFTDLTHQELVVPRPGTGTWKVVIDPVRVREKPLRYQLTVIATHPKWGELRASNAADTAGRPMTAGERWTIPLAIDARAAQAIGAGTGTSAELVGVVDLVAHNIPASKPGTAVSEWKTMSPEDVTAVVAQHIFPLKSGVVDGNR